MIDRALHPTDGENVEAVLRHELARGDATAESARPVLRQLLAADESLVLSDEIVARIRGMIEGIANTLLDALPDLAISDVVSLTRALLDTPTLLSHLHAMALEWRTAERLQARLGLDPVVPPLLEEMVSQDDATRDLALKFLAAQAHWCHLQRLMQLQIIELPEEVFNAVLLILLAQVAHHPDAAEHAVQAEAELRKRHDEAERRLDLAGQLVSRLDSGVQGALSVSHAGVALFLTALALGSGQDRDGVAISTDEAQLPRLALSLGSAGLETAEIERQLLALHLEAALPQGFDALNPGLATAILNSGRNGI